MSGLVASFTVFDMDLYHPIKSEYFCLWWQWCERPVVRQRQHKNPDASLWVQVRGSNTLDLMWWREYAAPWAQWLILINSGWLTSRAEFIQHWLLRLLRDGFDGVTTSLTFKIALKKKRREEQTGWRSEGELWKRVPVNLNEPKQVNWN